jgi:hypothetical protein
MDARQQSDGALASSQRAPGALLLALAACWVAGCTEPSVPGTPAPAPVVLGEFTGRVDAATGALVFEQAPGTARQGLEVLPVVQDGVPDSGPPDTLELVTESTAADMACGGLNRFCGEVTLRSFFTGRLSDVYVELTSLSDPTSVSVLNSDSVPPGGEVSAQYGLWAYGNLAAAGGSARRPWVFRTGSGNFTFRGRVMGVKAAVPSAATSTFTASAEEVVGDEKSEVTLTLTVRDAAGNLLSGVPVTFAVSRPSSDTLSALGGTTDAGGTLTVRLKSGAVGTATVTALFEGASLSREVRVVDVPSCDDGNACTTDAWVNGACSNTSLQDGTSCSDGNACTRADTCQAGACVGSSPVTCDDGNGCTTDACNPTTGACLNTSCEDGNACTVGTCQGSGPTASCGYAPVYVCSAARTHDTGAELFAAMAVPRGNAVVLEDRVRLNWEQQNGRGMATLAEKLSVREGFTVRFGFEFSHESSSRTGADGMAFVLHDASDFHPDPALAPSWLFFDDTGVASSRSVAVQLDSYQNSGEGSAKRLLVRGARNVLHTVTLTGDWSNSGPHVAEVTYRDRKLSVSIDGAAHVTDLALDLETYGAVDASGQAWAAFTSRTGGDTENHDVTSFSFTPVCPTAGAASCGAGTACTTASCDPGAGCQEAAAGGDDSDGDLTCRELDACPDSASDDADGNGACDDVDVCAALLTLGAEPTTVELQTAIPAEVGLPAAVLAGVTLDYQWTHGASLYTGATLPAGVTQKDEAWQLQVTASSGGVPLCSGTRSYTVLPRAPSYGSATSYEWSGGLRCVSLDSSDPDGAITGSACAFSDQTGAVLHTTTSTRHFCQLPAENMPTAAGTAVHCSIAPLYSGGVGSAATTVHDVGSNRAPVAPADFTVALDGVSTSSGSLRCSAPAYASTALPTATLSDPDGVWLAYRFRWFVGGRQVLTETHTRGATSTPTWDALSAATLAARGSALAEGDTVACLLDLYDGRGASPTLQAQQTVQGTEPRWEGHRFSPSPVVAGLPVTCSIGVVNDDAGAVNLRLYLMTSSSNTGTAFATSEATVTGRGWHWVSVTGTAPAVGTSFYCYAQYTDAQSSTWKAFASASAWTYGAAPAVSTPILTTDDGSVCSRLACSTTVTDTDTSGGTTQSAQVELTWLVDGAPYGTSTVSTHAGFGTQGATATLSAAGLPLEGTRVACRARTRATSADAWGDARTSPAVALTGSGPSLASTSVVAGAATRAGQTLTCAAGAVTAGRCTSAASSYATQTYAYAWRVNGQEVAGQTASTFSTAGLAGGDVVTCAMRVGLESGLLGAASVASSNAVTLLPGLWTIHGSTPGSYFGHGVAIVEDSDGDGAGEVLVGAPWAAADALTHAGKAYLLPAASGGTSSLATYESGALSGAKVFTGEAGGWDTTPGYCSLFDGDVCQADMLRELNDPARGPVGDALGFRVLAPGDMDGDGRPDLVLSAPWARGSGGYRQGRAYMVSGASAQGGSVAQYASGLTPGWAFEGEVGLLSSDVQRGITTRYGELAGWSLAGGDFDGDGLGDLAVGAPAAGGGWSVATHGSLSWIQSGGGIGRAYVTYGRADRQGLLWAYDALQDTVSDPLQVLEGNQPLSGLTTNVGAVMASAGQLDGDGRDSLLFGVLGFGNAWLLRGSALGDGTLDTQSATSSATATKLSAPCSLSLAGSFSPLAVTSGRCFVFEQHAGVGDVNGDGRDDVALVWTEPNTYVLSVFTEPGRVSTDVDGPRSGVGGFVVTGLPKEGSSRSGLAVFALGDVDGDGLDDFAFTVRPYADGAVQDTRLYVVHGKRDTGALTFQDLEAGRGGFTLETGEQVPQAESVAAGDLDGDGLSDVIWGAPYANGDTGLATVWFGRDGRGVLTAYGTPGADALGGTAGADSLVGGAGDDVLAGAGGADVLYGGAGDDTLQVGDTGFTRVNGGRGFDTLRLDSGSLSLTDTRGLVRNVEAVDLSRGTAALSLGAVDVLRLSSTSNSLSVYGSASNRLTTDTGWSAAETVTVQGRTLRQYVQGNARLLVQEGVATAIPPTFTSEDSFTVAEGSAVGTVVGRIAAVDPDGHIASLRISGAGAAVFGFDEATGNLTLRYDAALDHESKPSWTLSVTAVDDSGLTTTGTVTVEVTDVPEAPAFVTPGFAAQTSEGIDDGTPLVALAASDPDEGEVLTWSLTGGNTDGAFALDAATGTLSVGDGTLLDHETAPQRTLSVRVTDATGLSAEATVTVAVDDLTDITRTVSGTYARSGVDVFLQDPLWSWSAKSGSASGSLDVGTSVDYSLPSNAVMNGSLLMVTSGAITYSGTMTVSRNGFDVSVPMDVDLAFPDAARAGGTFTVSARAALRGDITVGGSQPEVAMQVGMGLDQVAMHGNLSFSSSFLGVSDKSLAFATGPLTGSGSLEKRYGGESFGWQRLGATHGTPVTVSGTTSDQALVGAARAVTQGTDPARTPVVLANPHLYYSQRIVTDLYNGYYDWNSYLQDLFPTWVSANSGKVTFDQGLGAKTELRWSLFPAQLTSSLGATAGSPSSLHVWMGLAASYALEWQGASVTLTFEDGTTTAFDVSYDGSTATHALTLPASADVNGDGRVAFTSSVTPKLQFYNWTKTFFRVNSYWYLGAAKVVTYDEQVNQFSLKGYQRTLYSREFGPVSSVLVRATKDFDDYLSQANAVESVYTVKDTVDIPFVTDPADEFSTFPVGDLVPTRVRGTVQLTP